MGIVNVHTSDISETWELNITPLPMAKYIWPIILRFLITLQGVLSLKISKSHKALFHCPFSTQYSLTRHNSAAIYCISISSVAHCTAWKHGLVFLAGWTELSGHITAHYPECRASAHLWIKKTIAATWSTTLDLSLVSHFIALILKSKTEINIVISKIAYFDT